MKNYHLTFSLAICVLLLTLIMGCGDKYDEGDETAKQRFDKMTAQEKALYTSVESKWGQKLLKSVREAVSRRETRPPENELPFKDLASVIKTNNTASLKTDPSQSASYQNGYILARWDRVDEDWYRNLMLSMGVKNIVKQDLIPEPVEEVIENTPDEIEPDHYGDRPWVAAPQRKIVKVDLKDLIPESQYDEIYYEIKKCPEAIEQYEQFIDERLLTWEDYELLVRISIKCKAIKIGEKLTEWKN